MSFDILIKKFFVHNNPSFIINILGVKYRIHNDQVHDLIRNHFSASLKKFKKIS